MRLIITKSTVGCIFFFHFCLNFNIDEIASEAKINLKLDSLNYIKLIQR